MENHDTFTSQNYLGYSLLEILVVLFMISLLVGLAAPRLINMYDSVQRAYEREEVLARLGGLSYLAFQQNRDFDLISYPPVTGQGDLTRQPVELELPVGWEVHTTQPIHFFANGACQGGIVSILYQKQQIQVELVPPFCSPKLL